MKEDLEKIIEHYGINNQLKKFNEESYELIEAILTREDYYQSSDTTIAIDKINLENITQEIADCLVLIEQFKLYYGITSEEITNIFWNKVARQLKRMEEGK